jgi:hypothetical protein
LCQKKLKHPDVRLKNCPEHLHLFLSRFEYFIFSSTLPSVIFYLCLYDVVYSTVQDKR